MRKEIGLSVPYRKTKELFTQDEIIEMARQAGFTPYGQRRLMLELEAFAKLVAARATEKNK